MRTVICHYHIYKNSGTSFDTLLENNFGQHHICFDGPFPFFSVDQEQLIKIINRKQDVVAFSSHQIQLPVPASLDVLVLPVIFLRHPLLRVQSIYKFKRQTFDGTTTSKNAQKLSFEAWVAACFDDPVEITHVSNAQVRMLGAAYREKTLVRRTAQGMEYDLQQALRNIQGVRLLARTEFFNEDVSRFPKILKEYGVDFNFSETKPQNTTSNDYTKSIDERLEGLKSRMSEESFMKLWNANIQDMTLYDVVTLECSVLS